MRVDLFDFILPPERIALRPAQPRDSARLLDVEDDGAMANNGLHDRLVRDLPGLLRPGDVLVVNDTRVIPARLFGRRGQARIEVLLHQADGDDSWRAFARPARKLKPGDRIDFDAPAGHEDGHTAAPLSATVTDKADGGEVGLRFDQAGPALMAAIAAVGHIPLPPYIRRPDDARDRQDYQTLFARSEGAVAAPTAGLHFTPDLVTALEARGLRRVAVTLHVGAGTFQPVKVEDTDDHRMHSERGIIDEPTAALLNATHAAGGRVVAVGTTSLRLIESAADPDGTVRPFAGATRLFITPGYRFRAVDLLLTNFHLPRSTLFMLVSAFAGVERMQQAYAHAIAHQYRFYSYGDACLLRRRSPPAPPG